MIRRTLLEQRILLGIGLALVLVVPSTLIVQKERLIRRGVSVFLELRPRDPRSLFQGDYMVLSHRICDDLGSSIGSWPRDGHVVLRLDERGVGRFVRLHTPGSAPASGEMLVRYRVRGNRLRLGSDAFFFQEGLADHYARARYSELKVDPSGNAVLVGLCDGELLRLGSDLAPAE